MIVLRQGKAKNILESSIDSSLTAVEIYNKPRTVFRLENYIVLMIIGWTKLFHAYFQSTIGDKYYYKGKNGRYIIVDGEKKAWELSECVKKYKHLPDAVNANLKFFIGIRNKIEHKFWTGSTLDILLFGECQSMLYNYENFLVKNFGQEYSINTCLAYALQFSHLRATEQIQSQRELLSTDMQDIKKYIDKYKTDLPQSVYDSQEYSIKLLQIPKVSNTNRSDLAVEFVNWTSLSEEDRDNYSRLCTMIKDKIVVQRVSNATLLKPSAVITAINDKCSTMLNLSNHTYLWKAFSVRPLNDSDSKFETIDKYCVYDEPHNDYLYTEDWVEFIVNLILNQGFSKDNVKTLCKHTLKIEDYQNEVM